MMVHRVGKSMRAISLNLLLLRGVGGLLPVLVLGALWWPTLLISLHKVFWGEHIYYFGF